MHALELREQALLTESPEGRKQYQEIRKALQDEHAGCGKVLYEIVAKAVAELDEAFEEYGKETAEINAIRRTAADLYAVEDNQDLRPIYVEGGILINNFRMAVSRWKNAQHLGTAANLFGEQD